MWNIPLICGLPPSAIFRGTERLAWVPSRCHFRLFAELARGGSRPRAELRAELAPAATPTGSRSLSPPSSPATSSRMTVARASGGACADGACHQDGRSSDPRVAAAELAPPPAELAPAGCGSGARARRWRSSDLLPWLVLPDGAFFSLCGPERRRGARVCRRGHRQPLCHAHRRGQLHRRAGGGLG